MIYGQIEEHLNIIIKSIQSNWPTDPIDDDDNISNGSFSLKYHDDNIIEKLNGKKKRKFSLHHHHHHLCLW